MHPSHLTHHINQSKQTNEGDRTDCLYAAKMADFRKTKFPESRSRNNNRDSANLHLWQQNEVFSTNILCRGLLGRISCVSLSMIIIIGEIAQCMQQYTGLGVARSYMFVGGQSDAEGARFEAPKAQRGWVRWFTIELGGHGPHGPYWLRLCIQPLVQFAWSCRRLSPIVRTYATFAVHQLPRKTAMYCHIQRFFIGLAAICDDFNCDTADIQLVCMFLLHLSTINRTWECVAETLFNILQTWHVWNNCDLAYTSVDVTRPTSTRDTENVYEHISLLGRWFACATDLSPLRANINRPRACIRGPAARQSSCSLSH